MEEDEKIAGKDGQTDQIGPPPSLNVLLSGQIGNMIKYIPIPVKEIPPARPASSMCYNYLICFSEV